MSSPQIPITKQMQRQYSDPIDPTFLWQSKLAAQNYAATNPTAYDGQILSYLDEGIRKLAIVQPDMTLFEVFSYDDTEIRQLISQETADREFADTDLQQQINDEVQRASDAEKNLQTLITDESDRAQTAESLLQENINTINDAINADVQTDTDIQNDESTVSIHIEYTNLQTGQKQTVVLPLPVVNQSGAGVMNAEDYKALQKAITDIAGLQGAGYVFANLGQSPSESVLTNAWVAAKGSQPIEGSNIINLDEGNRRYIFGNLGGTSQWVAQATFELPIAAHDVLGGIYSSISDGAGFVNTNGVLSINGWDTLKARVATLESTIASLQTLIDDKAPKTITLTAPTADAAPPAAVATPTLFTSIAQTVWNKLKWLFDRFDSSGNANAANRIMSRPPTGDIHTWLDSAPSGGLYWMNGIRYQTNQPGTPGDYWFYIGQKYSDLWINITAFPAVTTSRKTYTKTTYNGVWNNWIHIGDDANAATLENKLASAFATAIDMNWFKERWIEFIWDEAAKTGNEMIHVGKGKNIQIQVDVFDNGNTMRDAIIRFLKDGNTAGVGIYGNIFSISASNYRELPLHLSFKEVFGHATTAGNTSENAGKLVVTDPETNKLPESLLPSNVGIVQESGTWTPTGNNILTGIGLFQRIGNVLFVYGSLRYSLASDLTIYGLSNFNLVQNSKFPLSIAGDRGSFYEQQVIGSVSTDTQDNIITIYNLEFDASSSYMISFSATCFIQTQIPDK